MIRVNLGFVVPSDGEFLSRDVATDRGVRQLWRVLVRMRRHPIQTARLLDQETGCSDRLRE